MLNKENDHFDEPALYLPLQMWRRVEEQTKGARSLVADLLCVIQDGITALGIEEREGGEVVHLPTERVEEALQFSQRVERVALLVELSDAKHEAVEIYRLQLRIERAAGCAPERIGGTMVNIGVALEGQRRHIDALTQYESALALLRETHGDAPSQDVVVCLGGLGRCYEMIEELDTALDRHQEVNAMLEALGLRDSLQMSTALVNHAAALTKVSRYAEAEEAYRRALTIKRAHLGDDHPSLSTLYRGLAQVLLSLGDHDEAVETGRKSLHLLETTFTCGNPTLETTRRALIHVLISSDHAAEAQQVAAAAVTSLRDAGCRGELLHALSSLQEAHTAAGQLTEALSVCNGLVDEAIRSRTTDPQAAIQLACTTAAKRARLQQHLGVDVDAVIADLMRLAQIMIDEELLEVVPYATTELFWSIWPLQRGVGDHAAALDILTHLLNVSRHCVQRNVPPVLRQCVSCLESLGRLEEALVLMEDDMNMTAKLYGQDHRDLGAHLLNIGATRLLIADYGGAVECYVKATQVFERAGEDASVAETHAIRRNKTHALWTAAVVGDTETRATLAQLTAQLLQDVPLPSCLSPHRHLVTLSPDTADAAPWICNGCGRPSLWYSIGSRFQCQRGCAFSYCESCSQQALCGTPPPPHEHVLVEMPTGNGWVCDGCEVEVSIEDGDLRFHCSQGCDFDYCEVCNARSSAGQTETQQPEPVELVIEPAHLLFGTTLAALDSLIAKQEASL